MNDHHNPEENLITNCQRMIGKELHSHQDSMELLRSLIPLFQLPHQQRSKSQLNTIYQIFRNIPFFKTLETLESPEIVKSLIKHGKLLLLSENHQICQQDILLNNFIFAIHGHFGLIDKPLQQPIKLYDQKTHLQFFQQFKDFSSSYLQLLKRKQPKTKKTYRPQKVSIRQEQISCKLIASPQSQLIFLGQKTVINNKTQIKKYSQSVVTLGKQNFIFMIDLRKFCELMLEYHSKGLQNEMNHFLTFSCFHLFKKEKLMSFVDNTETIKLRKNDILFKEGQQDNRIFILKSGEIQLQKTASLNKQNPNDFYKSRLFIKRSLMGQKLSKKIQSIPFADFTKVYNAKTTKKKVKLSCISPISILGEEEIISKRSTRQTTATIISQEAELSVFYLSQLQKIIPNAGSFTIQTFLKILEEEITNKKILFRQEKLGSDIIYLNKTSQNGFFLNNEPERRTLQSRKRANSLRNTVSTSQQKFVDSQSQVNKLFSTASFTCHNFDDFYKANEKDEIKPTKLNLTRPSSTVNKKQQSRIKYTNQEREIIKLLHENQLSNRGNKKRSSSRSQSRPSSKIDIEKPLFSAQYFKEQIERSRKLDKDIRKSKLEGLYSKPMNSTFFQSRKFKTLSNSVINDPKQKQKHTLKRNFSSQK